MSSEQTTIRISKDTHDKLTQLGKFGETYDDILRRVLSVREVKQ
jgi:hypothetical protein